MRPYKFYIQNGKAVRHPLNGGNVEGFAGSSQNPAVQVVAQGSKVLVTFENGQVQEWPWPGEGGNMRTLVQGQSHPRRQEVPVSTGRYSNIADQDEDTEIEQEFAVSNSSYEAPKKKSCLGCIFKLMVLGIVGFFALAALGYFLDKGEDKNSGTTPDESNSSGETNAGERNSKTNSEGSADGDVVSEDQGASSSSGDPVKKPARVSSPFENKEFPLHIIVTEEVNLLNSAGKEIAIPKGVVIRIDKRSDSGTLTLSLNDELFVGNEARLIGKVKLR